LNTRLKIPVLYAIDAVHGNALIEKTVVFPHNIALGCMNDPKAYGKSRTRHIGGPRNLLVTAEKSIGHLLPALPWLRTKDGEELYESYSENPSVVKNECSEHSSKGLQGNDFF